VGSKVLVEVCCGSIDDVLQSAAGGADRVELNSAFFLGGLTPSLGTLRECKARVDIPIIAMVRPRSGGMHYSDAEFATMLQDAALFREAGADGIVFGFLREDGRVDAPRCREMIQAIGDKEAVFHRAFDLTPDPEEALETLIALGVRRVLTSGQKANVFHAQEMIKKLIAQARGRIEILPGAGLDEYNLEAFVAATGTTQVHIAPMDWANDLSAAANPSITFGGAVFPSETRFQAIKADLLLRMTALLMS